jgi:two-component system response regulator PilR (NtrC family)
MSARSKLLVVDDEVGWIEVFTAALKNDPIAVQGAGTVAEGAQYLKSEGFDLLFVDLKLPDGSGLDLVRVAREADPDLAIVVFTAHPTLDTAIEAVRQGAYDYLVKPFSRDQLRHVVKRALECRRLRSENRLLAQRVQGLPAGELVGQSAPMQAVFRRIEQVGPTDSEVLILGESGTGKELAARAIHKGSRRRQRPFVPVDCGALPESLIESELLGHEKGAFTGATHRQIGLFEYAEGGTVFLDEIGELAKGSQVKLLRVLQERRLRRVGGRESLPVDVRVIAATNQKLDEEVKAGRFREDLFYRLDVFEVALPPLRDRQGDIALLSQHFLVQVAQELGTPTVGLDPAVLFERFDWPGNVRQLKNTLKSAAILAGDGPIRLQHLPPALQPLSAEQGDTDEPAHSGFHALRNRAIESFERDYLAELLDRHHGSVSAAAREAGLSRSSFYYLMQRHGLDAASFRADGPGD